MTLELPASVTPLARTGLLTDVEQLPGRPFAVAGTGEILTGLADGVTLGRMHLGGRATPVKQTYREHGVAGGPGGGASDPIPTADGLVWRASPDVSDDLRVLDFVVYAADRSGGSIRQIGHSSPDVAYLDTTRNVVAPYGRERLTAVGDRAYWMESTREIGDPTTPARMGEGVEHPFGVQVMSAPLDGSTPQRSSFAGWHHGEDLCSPPDAPTLYYLDSRGSQSPDSDTAALHSATVDADGRVARDRVLWSGPEPDDTTLTAAAACGETTVLAWDSTPPPDGERRDAVLEIRHDGTVIAIPAPAGTYFSDPVVTPGAVFFLTVGGDVDGHYYVLDLATDELFHFFDQTGFYDMLYTSRTTVAWLDSSVDRPDGAFDQVFMAGRLAG